MRTFRRSARLSPNSAQVPRETEHQKQLFPYISIDSALECSVVRVMTSQCPTSSCIRKPGSELRNGKVLGACTTVRNGAHISYPESRLRPVLYLVFSLDPLE